MFTKLHSAIASAMGLAPAPAPAPVPVTPLRIAARAMLTAVEGAIANGDWTVDGAADPDLAIARLGAALASHASEIEVADRTLDLVDIALPEISDGAWSVNGDGLEALIEASVAATPLASANDDGVRSARAA